MQNPTKNEIELEYRIEKLEEHVFTNDNIQIAKECAKGAINGTVDLMGELVLIKHEITELQIRFTKLINYVANHT